jgi:hypothetical protein
MIVHSACEELVNRASPAFGMLPTPMRCATKVIERYADPALRAEWAPRLVAGEWARPSAFPKRRPDRMFPAADHGRAAGTAPGASPGKRSGSASATMT